MIAKSNFKVKLETNEHLKKVFPEETELFYIKTRWAFLKNKLLSTFEKIIVCFKNLWVSNRQIIVVRQASFQAHERAATRAASPDMMQS